MTAGAGGLLTRQKGESSRATKHTLWLGLWESWGGVSMSHKHVAMGGNCSIKVTVKGPAVREETHMLQQRDCRSAANVIYR